MSERTSRNGEDLISNLPDDPLRHILSFLPIREAVQTCILSKSWESQWTGISNVKLDGLPSASFVEKVLLYLQGIKNFHFTFSCHEEYEKRRLTKWIAVILRKEIECIELRVRYEENARGINVHPIVPCDLLKYDLLKKLVVDLSCTLKVSGSICFPNLTDLSLKKVKILNEQQSKNDTLIFNVPALKWCDLENCEWLEVKSVEIYAPSLTVFNSTTPSNSHVNNLCNYLIKITGAKLENLIITGGYPENIILADSTVDSACLTYNLDNVDDLGLQILKQLRELHHLKVLCLIGPHVLEAIAQMKRVGLIFPKFLELEYMCELLYHPFDAEGLLELLHAAPCLKSLRLRISIRDQYNYDAAESSVPSCLVSYLERVQLVYACGDPNFNLIKFFLREGLCLKSVLVLDSPDFPTDEIINQLSAFPKVSTCITIEPL